MGCFEINELFSAIFTNNSAIYSRKTDNSQQTKIEKKVTTMWWNEEVCMVKNTLMNEV